MLNLFASASASTDDPTQVFVALISSGFGVLLGAIVSFFLTLMNRKYTEDKRTFFENRGLSDNDYSAVTSLMYHLSQSIVVIRENSITLKSYVSAVETDQQYIPLPINSLHSFDFSLTGYRNVLNRNVHMHMQAMFYTTKSLNKDIADFDRSYKRLLDKTVDQHFSQTEFPQEFMKHENEFIKSACSDLLKRHEKYLDTIYEEITLLATYASYRGSLRIEAIKNGEKLYGAITQIIDYVPDEKLVESKLSEIKIQYSSIFSK